MDLQKTIDFLRGEIRRLEGVVASLEELRDGLTVNQGAEILRSFILPERRHQPAVNGYLSVPGQVEQVFPNLFRA